MKVKKISSVVLLGLGVILSGCTSTLKVKDENSNNVILNTDAVVHLTANGSSSYASGVRWNEDYVVTVQHLKGFSSKEKCDSDHFDLAFMKDPINENDVIEVWNEPESGRKVVMTGSSLHRMIRAVEGTVVKGKFPYKTKPDYRLVTGQVKKGMSGGPVKNLDNEVVGIVIGYTIPILLNGESEKEEKKVYSVILPYDTIEKEWENIKKKIDNKECFT